jgi:hypothetical protein
MAVLKDYYCETHGIFEAWEAKCPMKNCKGELSVVFLKPVGIKSDKTKKTDKTVNQLAIDYDMTDMKSAKEGEYQTGYMKRNNKLSDKEFEQATQAMNAQNKEARPGESAIWGGGGNISMKSVMDGQFKSINGESVGINPKAAGNLAGPRAASYMSDPDNLQVSKP